MALKNIGIGWEQISKIQLQIEQELNVRRPVATGLGSE
jgi:hypothetical protein